MEFDQSGYRIITIDDKIEIILNIDYKSVNMSKFCGKLTKLFKYDIPFDSINNEKNCQRLIKSYERQIINSDLKYDKNRIYTIDKLTDLTIYYQIPKRKTEIYNGIYCPIYILDYIIMTTIPEYYKPIHDEIDKYFNNEYQITISKKVAEIHALKDKIFKLEQENKNQIQKNNDLEDELEETKQEIKYKLNDIRQINNHSNNLVGTINKLQNNLIIQHETYYKLMIKYTSILVCLFGICLLILSIFK